MSFALGTIVLGEREEAALRIGAQAYTIRDIAQALKIDLPDTVLGLLNHWSDVLPRLEGAAAAIGKGKVHVAGRDLADVKLAQPVRSRKVYCVGANYADHLLEMGASDAHKPGQPPFFFMKPASTAICGPGDTVRIPDGCENFDWEGEVVVVFGKGGKNISPDKALEHIAGYTLGIDFTARDQFEAPELLFRFNFALGKCQDNTAPVGPWIAPSSSVDGTDLPFSLAVNGVQKQSSSTRMMLYTLQEQIAEISRRIAIEPGDLLFTGTPAGVGRPRGERIHHGDTVAVTGDVIGRLVVRVLANGND
ncbi:fumarylacetoacetate hydrolase family protein [Paraburkholderia sediminicola]|uniref:fumarylacetoacetate hydrolase family protein n=1 Tax=Paraburkholderia sediminicola TaxID=458836 RepID=UPI0038BCC620